MHPSNLHFFPLALPFVLGLFLLMGLLMALIEVGILKYAYTKIGIDPRYVFLVLLLSLVGSYVNIPVAHLPGEQVITGRTITYFGMRYIIPMVQEWPGTLIGADLLNLGQIQGLGAPVASIGGAGTFDGIFITGILAVLLA